MIVEYYICVILRSKCLLKKVSSIIPPYNEKYAFRTIITDFHDSKGRIKIHFVVHVMICCLLIGKHMSNIGKKYTFVMTGNGCPCNRFV